MTAAAAPRNLEESRENIGPDAARSCPDFNAVLNGTFHARNTPP